MSVNNVLHDEDNVARRIVMHRTTWDRLVRLAKQKNLDYLTFFYALMDDLADKLEAEDD